MLYLVLLRILVYATRPKYLLIINLHARFNSLAVNQLSTSSINYEPGADVAQEDPRQVVRALQA